MPISFVGRYPFVDGRWMCLHPLVRLKHKLPLAAAIVRTVLRLCGPQRA